MLVVRRIFVALGLLMIIGVANAASDFVVREIRVEGLQKISLDTVKSYLPVKVGEKLDALKTQEIIRTLYRTGFFNDVSLAEQGNTLIVKVVERSVIGSLNISGNKEITKKQLMDALKNAGFTEGHPYDDATLYGLKQALLQQYYGTGYYNVQVTTKTIPLERGRVQVDIIIDEGAQAKVKSITIVGNHAFKTSKLLDNFSLTTTKLWSFITHSDQYSKEKLDADLESLRSFYLDNGYLRFKVDSSKATMSPDKKDVNIIIYVTEGPQFTISGCDVEGNLLGKGAEITKLITLQRGEVFSRKKIIDINNAIGHYLGDFGYAMPDIQSDPEINDTTKQIFIHFKINVGKRVYVHQINFSGNTKTKEIVLRREMRQQEGALYSASKIEESKRRLNNLGYLQDIDVKVAPVPGYNDEVDVDYSMKEASSASASVQLGYSDIDKFIYGANLVDRNFLGTGKNVGLQFSHSQYSNGYSANYFDPYFTQDNVSLSVNAYTTKTTPSSITNLSSYNTQAYGIDAIFGVPTSDYAGITMGYGFENIALQSTGSSSQQILQFIQQFGSVFNTGKLYAGWNYSKLDRAVFPTDGIAQNLNLEFAMPLGGKSRLQYYKGNYYGVYYKPIYKDFIFRINANVAYGNGYGAMTNLPFFKDYYCGGIGTVRGFQGDSLGPRDSNGNALGGSFLTVASGSLIFPNPLGETVRSSVFVDAGNVYDHRFKLDDIRSSVGLQIEWRSPIGGVFVFSIARPIKKKAEDHLEWFQFNLGASMG